jgi:hypothetical protein
MYSKASVNVLSYLPLAWLCSSQSVTRCFREFDTLMTGSIVGCELAEGVNVWPSESVRDCVFRSSRREFRAWVPSWPASGRSPDCGLDDLMGLPNAMASAQSRASRAGSMGMLVLDSTVTASSACPCRSSLSSSCNARLFCRFLAFSVCQESTNHRISQQNVRRGTKLTNGVRQKNICVALPCSFNLESDQFRCEYFPTSVSMQL